MATVAHPRQAIRPRLTLRREWVVTFVWAELLGFVPPAVTGVALVTLDVTDFWLVIGLTAAGLLEGAAIGYANAWVLRRHAPEIDGTAWLRGTVLGAGFAWLVGMGGSALLGASDAPIGPLLVLMVPAWIAGLLAMGYLQWRVLRPVAPRSLRWIWISAGAWLVGVMMPVVTLSVVPNGWPPVAHIAAGVGGAVAMGLTVGLLTGGALQRILADSADVTDGAQRDRAGLSRS